MFGGADDDRVAGEWNSDFVKGGSGDDYLDGSDAQSADTFSGGAGVDFIAYDRTEDVAVTLDDLPNDGAAGEDDNVRSNVEDVVTGAGNDRIVGSGAANDLTGGAGNDRIRAGGGNDGLDGDLGRDTMDGGSGTDSVSGGEVWTRSALTTAVPTTSPVQAPSTQSTVIGAIRLPSTARFRADTFSRDRTRCPRGQPSPGDRRRAVARGRSA